MKKKIALILMMIIGMGRVNAEDLIEEEVKELNTPTFKTTVLESSYINVTIDEYNEELTYSLYKATSSTGKYSLVKTLTSDSYTDKSVTIGKKYYYKVKVCDLEQCVKSEVVSAKSKLGIPSASATSSNKTTNKISYNKVSGASGYQIYYSTKKNGTYKLLKATTATSYSHKNLTTGKTYYYKVRAYKTVKDKKYYSSFSSVVSSVPKVGKPTFTASSYDYNINKIVIKKVSGASGYYIYRSEEEDGTYTLLKNTTSLTYYDKNLELGKTYYYKVKAYALVSKTKKFGSYSNILPSTPNLRTPSLSIDSSSSRESLSLTLKSVNGATNYEVYKFNGEEYSLLETVTNTNEKIVDTDVTYGETYSYKVRAVNGEHYSEYYEASDMVRPVVLDIDLNSEVYGFNILSANIPELSDYQNYVGDYTISIYRKTSKTDYSLLASKNFFDDYMDYATYEETTIADVIDTLLTSTRDENVSFFTYIDTKIEYGQTYTYKVVVTSNEVSSNSSNEVSMTLKLKKPAETIALRKSFTQNKVVVDAVSGADGYEWYQATSKKGTYKKVKTTTVNQAFLSATYGKTYYYKARAYKVINGKKVYSSFSPIKSLKTVLKDLDDYPMTLTSKDRTSYGVIKSVTVSAKAKAVDYEKYSFKINFSKTYSMTGNDAKYTVKFYDENLNWVYTYYLTQENVKKGTKKNYSVAFTVVIPRTAVYFMFV